MAPHGRGDGPIHVVRCADDYVCHVDEPFAGDYAVIVEADVGRSVPFFPLVGS